MDRKMAKAKRKLERRLLRKPGVVGVGCDGEYLIVYVEDAAAASLVSGSFDGYPVKVIVSGRIEALGFFRPEGGKGLRDGEDEEAQAGPLRR